MSIIKTDTMSKEEIIFHYERIGDDCIKLASENAQLISDNKYFRTEIERLESVINEYKRK